MVILDIYIFLNIDENFESTEIKKRNCIQTVLKLNYVYELLNKPWALEMHSKLQDHISPRQLGECWPTLINNAPQILHVAGSQALLLPQSDY